MIVITTMVVIAAVVYFSGEWLGKRSMREWDRRYDPKTQRRTADATAWTRRRIDFTWRASVALRIIGGLAVLFAWVLIISRTIEGAAS